MTETLEPRTDVNQARGASSPWPALLVLMTGTFMAILDVFIVLVAAPTIQANLHASDAVVQFVLAGYQLTYAVTLITAGRLGDLYGRKRLFIAGMALFTLTSLACGAAPSGSTLIAARLVQGVGAALMFPQVFSMIGVLVPEHKRPRAFGALGAVIGAATIVGQVVGGLLIQADLFGTGWRPVFWINVPIGVLALVLAARLVPESRIREARGLDLPGVAALTLALFLLVVPLVEGRELGWPSWTWLCLAASVLAFAGFLVVERRVETHGRAPLIGRGLIAQRPFVIGCGLVLALYAALNSFFLILSLTLQDGLGMSALAAGLVYAPQAATFFGVSLLAGRLVPRYGRRVLEAGAALTTLGFAATATVAWTCGGHLDVIQIVPTLLVQGLGMGLLVTPLLHAVLARVDDRHAGTASGVLSTAQQVGGAFGVAVVGVVFFGLLGSVADPGAGTYVRGLAIAVLVNLALAAITTVLVYALPARHEASP